MLLLLLDFLALQEWRSVALTLPMLTPPSPSLRNEPMIRNRKPSKDSSQRQLANPATTLLRSLLATNGERQAHATHSMLDSAFALPHPHVPP